MKRIPKLNSDAVMAELANLSETTGSALHEAAVRELALSEDLSTRTAAQRVAPKSTFVRREFDKRTMALQPCSLDQALKYLCVAAFVTQLRDVIDVKHLEEQDAMLEEMDFDELSELVGIDEDFGGFA